MRERCTIVRFLKYLRAAILPIFLFVLTVSAAWGGVWAPTGSLATVRQGNSTTLLPNGKVLVTGGYNNVSGYLASSELYDPTSNSWSSAESMGSGRSEHTATLLPNGKVLIAGGRKIVNGSIYYAGSELYDPTSNSWSSAGNLVTGRYGHTATLLPNGKVLVAGGYGNGYLASAELYDPINNSWSAAGSLIAGRSGQTATLLSSGMVLVVGGTISSYKGAISSTELYDPTSNSWIAVGSMGTTRTGHSSTLLPDGKVLVVGGDRYGNFGSPLNSVELFDPASNSWSAVANLAAARYGHSATMLSNGKVLVVGGEDLSRVELYDPNTNNWSSPGSLATGRSYHGATLLLNGKVLVSGGGVGSSLVSSCLLFDPEAVNSWSEAGQLAVARPGSSTSLLPNGKVLVSGGSLSGSIPIASAELYDPIINRWSAATSMNTARSAHSATVLPNGKVLVAGGNDGGPIASAELYDPDTNSWSQAGAMTFARQTHTATLLPDGKVLVAGGMGNPPDYYLASAELYDPYTNSWSLAGTMTTARSSHSSTLLPNGKVLVVGGFSLINNMIASAELYDPATNTWSSTASLAIARDNHTATLLLNGKVLVTGGTKGSIPYLSSVEQYDPENNSWSTMAPLVDNRQGHSATLLADGSVLVAGGMTYPSGTVGGVEIYNPASNNWRATDSLLVPRVFHSAVLLYNGNVLVVGGKYGYAPSFQLIAGAEIYNAAPLDSTPPKITPSITGTLVNGWYTGKVTVALAATDNASGVKSVSYAIDGGSVTVVSGATATFDLFGDGVRNAVYGAIDNTGNAANGSITIPIDTTPPTFTQIVMTPPNANGWYNKDVTVHFSATDALSGLASLTPDATVTTEGAGQTVTGTAVDVAGNSSSYTQTGINVDKTVPLISTIVTPAPVNGWNNTGVTVTFLCSDALSGIAQCPAPIIVSTEGANQSITGMAVDKAGNTATVSVTLNIDKTSPAITGASLTPPNANGWYNGNVTVHFSATDALSGLASLTPDTVVSNEGTGQTVTGTAVDVAGNGASYAVAGINLDKTPPVLMITGITNGATYNLGLVPQASFSAVDGISGVATSRGSLTGGDAQGLGQFTYAVTATDKAGNTAITSVSYTVNATTTGTVALINQLAATGLIDQQTAANLSSTLATAMAFYANGNSTAGDEKMGAFINQVNAPGQNIPPEIITMLINAANYIIAHN